VALNKIRIFDDSFISIFKSEGHEKDYNYWIRRYLELERKAPGYLGTTIIIAGGSKSAKAAPKAKFPKLKE
jgi:antibiotic biosynthesis monooxygenase (ABM) superfamily enzyme